MSHCFSCCRRDEDIQLRSCALCWAGSASALSEFKGATRRSGSDERAGDGEEGEKWSQTGHFWTSPLSASGRRYRSPPSISLVMSLLCCVFSAGRTSLLRQTSSSTLPIQPIARPFRIPGLLDPPCSPRARAAARPASCALRTSVHSPLPHFSPRTYDLHDYHCRRC